MGCATAFASAFHHKVPSRPSICAETVPSGSNGQTPPFVLSDASSLISLASAYGAEVFGWLFPPVTDPPRRHLPCIENLWRNRRPPPTYSKSVFVYGRHTRARDRPSHALKNTRFRQGPTRRS